MPNTSFEEGTELVIDREVIGLAAGWTEAASGSDVFRQGDQVVATLRVKNAAKAAALITTLAQDYRPAVAVANAAGTVEVKPNGEVVSLEGATALETGKARVYEISFRAGIETP